MIRTFRLLPALLLALCINSGALLASSISIELGTVGTSTVDGKTMPTVAAGEQFEIIITLTDFNHNRVDLPGLERFNVVGQSNSQEINSFNGRQSSRIIKRVTLVAEQTGECTLGPIKANANGTAIESNSIAIRIASNGSTIKQATTPPPSQQATGSSENQPMVVCKLTAETTHAVVGQAIPITASVYLAGPVLECGFAQDPSKPDGPISVPGCTVKEIQAEQKHADTYQGRPCTRLDKKYILFPLQQGEKTIQPIQVIFVVRSPQRRHHNPFFDAFINFGSNSIEQHQTQSNPLTINVSPLPQHHGAVDGIGSFTKYTAAVDKTDVNTNDPVILTLTIEGKGNFEHIATPKLSLPESFKYYDSKTSIHEDLSTAYKGGSKQFEFIVQALQPGTLTIPSQTFSFFDITSKSYTSLKTEPISLEIKQRAGTPRATPRHPINDREQESDKPQHPTVQDINFIREDADTQTPATAPLPWWLFVLLLLTPLVIYQHRLLTMLSNRWHSNTNHTTSRLAKDLKTLIASNNANQLYVFFLQVFALHNNIEQTTVSEDWIEQNLALQGWEEKRIAEFMDYLSLCARFHFSPHTINTTDHQRLLEMAQYWFALLTK